MTWRQWRRRCDPIYVKSLHSTCVTREPKRMSTNEATPTRLHWLCWLKREMLLRIAVSLLITLCSFAFAGTFLTPLLQYMLWHRSSTIRSMKSFLSNVRYKICTCILHWFYLWFCIWLDTEEIHWGNQIHFCWFNNTMRIEMLYTQLKTTGSSHGSFWSESKVSNISAVISAYYTLRK